MEYALVSPTVKVPENLKDLWGGEYGCPIKNEAGEVIGFAANMPQHEGEEVEAIKLSGEKTTIVG